MARIHIYLKAIALSIGISFLTGCVQHETFYVTGLACENLREPMGINTCKPRFSWKNKSDQQGANQTAYQLLVASSIRHLNDDNGSYWDSGKIESPDISAEYNGKSLQSGQLLFWKIRTWDEHGKVSKWSKPSSFSIGLLDKEDWEASYIGYPSEKGFYACPQLQKKFSITKKKNDTYLLHVNSLGYHEVYINGDKVGEDVLSPAVSQFNKRSLVVTYNVTPLLKGGNNELIIWLGSGWYTEGLPGVTGSGPVVRAQLEHVNEEAKEIVVSTDDSWVGRNSEYERISNWRSGRYGGEIVTGNLEARNKALQTPDALTWEKVIIAEVPEHEASPQMVEANRIMETIQPDKIERLNDSTYLVDMGKCISGWFEITFPPLQESSEIIMEYSDHLTENGELRGQGQIDRYIASGNGTELFKNKFNYHGFQYIKISNLETPPRLEDIKAHLIHTNFETTASFECSDDDLNRIHDMVSYTLRCVGLGGYLVDCPQIERLGYGGDGNASTITAQTMFNMAPLYNNWLQAWSDVIREDGSMPHTAPNPYAAGGGPYWCGFIISATWNSYQHYGDVRLLKKYYPVMQKWLGYVDYHLVNGLLKRWPDTDYRAWYLGDWATPDGIGDPNHSDERSVDLVNNCYIAVCFDQMTKIAKVLGNNDDAYYYSERGDQLKEKIQETFYDPARDLYATGSQIDLIFPMLAGVTPMELRDKVTDKLQETTETEFNGHLNTGLVGIPVMMEWAATVREPNFIYSMLKKRAHPGYLYMLDRGATTTWEHWGGHRSRIHNCYNGVGQWFYQVVGGIRSIDGEVGYRKFLIDPQIPAGVNWAKTSVETLYGTISVHWELLSEKLVLKVDVPVGSAAELVVPTSTTHLAINNQTTQNISSAISLESGKYVVEYFFH